MTTEPKSPSLASSRAALPARTSVVFVGEAVLFVVVILLVVVEIVVVGDLELDRRVVDDAQQGTALRAGELIADVDIGFVDVDVGITLGANGGHSKGSLGRFALEDYILSKTM